MNIFLIVSIGLSLTQLVTLGWLSRTVTRVRRATADLEYRNQGNHVALDCHERRIDVAYRNHETVIKRCDELQRKFDFAAECVSTVMKRTDGFEDQFYRREQVEAELQRQIEYLVEQYSRLDADIEDTIAETVEHEKATERQFAGVNGAINHFDDVLIQNGGGL